jgi:hypothetical protein
MLAMAWLAFHTQTDTQEDWAKMKKFLHLASLAIFMLGQPALAAPDMGLHLHDTGIGHRSTGIGVSASVRIGLGADRVVKESERVKIGVSAGPTFSMLDADAPNGIRRGSVSLIGIEIQPDYATRFKAAGLPIAVDYTRLGAAEKDSEDTEEDRQSTGDKVAWVAAVAGGVMLALVGIYAASCGPGESHSCGSD